METNTQHDNSLKSSDTARQCDIRIYREHGERIRGVHACMYAYMHKISPCIKKSMRLIINNIR